MLRFPFTFVQAVTWTSKTSCIFTFGNVTIILHTKTHKDKMVQDTRYISPERGEFRVRIPIGHEFNREYDPADYKQMLCKTYDNALSWRDKTLEDMGTDIDKHWFMRKNLGLFGCKKSKSPLQSGISEYKYNDNGIIRYKFVVQSKLGERALRKTYCYRPVPRKANQRTRREAYSLAQEEKKRQVDDLLGNI